MHPQRSTLATTGRVIGIISKEDGTGLPRRLRKKHGLETPYNDIRQSLGDWLRARTGKHAEAQELPFKQRAGYCAAWGTLNAEFAGSAHSRGLLRAYPKARFVLMHIAQPYDSKLNATAKHFPNVAVDMCWAW